MATWSNPSATRYPQALRSLRHRNYRLFFMGQSISLVGTWMQSVAMQVLVYRLTGSATALGLVSFIGVIPVLLLSLWGGSVADRLPKRNVLVVAQVAMLIQALLLAYLTKNDAVQIWHVYALALLLGAAQAIDIPVRLAFTVEMVEGKEDLANAIGLNSAMFNGARALGPALAGAAVAATGEATAFLINALTFAPVLVALIRMRDLPPPSLEARKSTGAVQHMTEGTRYVLRNQVLLVLVSLIGVSAFLAMPYATLMPVFAKNVLGQSAQPVVKALCSQFITCRTPEALPLGILLTMTGVGAVVGAFLVAGLPERAQRGRLLTIGNLAFPALLLVFVLSRSFLLSALILILVGVSFVWQNALANTLLQLQAPDHLRGRIMSLYSITFQVTMRMGSLQAGLSADRLGPVLAVGAGAVMALLYGLYVAMRFPHIRRLA